MRTLYGSKRSRKNKRNHLPIKTKMSCATVECPICFKNFSSDFIEIHAQQCKGEDLTKSDKSEAADPDAKRMKISSKTHTFFSPKAKSSSAKQSAGRVRSLGTTPNKTVGLKLDRLELNRPKATDGGLDDIVPLAERSRPTKLCEYIGQEQVLGQGCTLNELLKTGVVPSMILWGPPGCGKTSLAHVIATQAKSTPNSSTRFVKLSATNSGKADVQAAITAAKNERRMFQRKTILFIDEIHRFNKLQQDTFLPHVENGTIILIGATTENPSFSLNSALLSRCRVIVLEKLSMDDVKTILLGSLKKCESAIKILWKNGELSHCHNSDSTKESSSDCEVVHANEAPMNLNEVTISEEAVDFLSSMCDGDARTALNSLQMAIQSSRSQSSGNNAPKIDVDCIKKSLHRSHTLYDRVGDQHYEMISAFHKSIRGSDDNATLYWLTRMLEGGEDPKFIARRLLVIASEDIGLADSNALNLAVSTQQACQFIGMPECGVVLAHCSVYMARAPKSVEVYMAYTRAKECIKNHQGPLPGVPLHLRNASTKLMKDLGYGKGYQYIPPSDGSQTYLPDTLLKCNFFDQ